jgi:hypothetical protein
MNANEEHYAIADRFDPPKGRPTVGIDTLLAFTQKKNQ